MLLQLLSRLYAVEISALGRVVSTEPAVYMSNTRLAIENDVQPKKITMQVLL